MGQTWVPCACAALLALRPLGLTPRAAAPAPLAADARAPYSTPSYATDLLSAKLMRMVERSFDAALERGSDHPASPRERRDAFRAMAEGFDGDDARSRALVDTLIRVRPLAIHGPELYPCCRFLALTCFPSFCPRQNAVKTSGFQRDPPKECACAECLRGGSSRSTLRRQNAVSLRQHRSQFAALTNPLANPPNEDEYDDEDDEEEAEPNASSSRMSRLLALNRGRLASAATLAETAAHDAESSAASASRLSGLPAPSAGNTLAELLSRHIARAEQRGAEPRTRLPDFDPETSSSDDENDDDDMSGWNADFSSLLARTGGHDAAMADPDEDESTDEEASAGADAAAAAVAVERGRERTPYDDEWLPVSALPMLRGAPPYSRPAFPSPPLSTAVSAPSGSPRRPAPAGERPHLASELPDLVAPPQPPSDIQRTATVNAALVNADAGPSSTPASTGGASDPTTAAANAISAARVAQRLYQTLRDHELSVPDDLLAAFFRIQSQALASLDPAAAERRSGRRRAAEEAVWAEEPERRRTPAGSASVDADGGGGSSAR